MPSGLSVGALSEYTSRLLEVVELKSEGDGELYAQLIKELFLQIRIQSVLESAVETILVYVRLGECGMTLYYDESKWNALADTSFRLPCAASLVASIADPQATIGPTLMVVMAPLACEYSGQLSVPPPDILRGISSRLPSYPGAEYSSLATRYTSQSSSYGAGCLSSSDVAHFGRLYRRPI